MTPELRAALRHAVVTSGSEDLEGDLDAIAPIIDAAIEGHRAQAHGTGYVQGERRGREEALLAADDLDAEWRARRPYTDGYGEGMCDAFDIAGQRLRGRANDA